MSDENQDLGNTASDAGPEISETLEAKVEAGLASVFSGQDDEPINESAETVEGDGKTAQVEEKAEGVDTLAAADGTDATESAAAEKPQGEVAPVASPASTIPAAYVRSLKALEWTDEEIAEASKHPNFLTTAERLHRTRNKEIAAWAEMGRKQREQSTQQQTNVSQQQQQAASQMLDVSALKAKYGDDALIDALTAPINAQIKRLEALEAQTQQTQQRSQQAELEMLGKQINQFFGGAELKPFEKLYATPDGKNKVLETADALIAGARMQGRNLSLGEALQMAHDSTSGEFKVEAARSDIKAKLQTRSRGITLKPSGRGAGAGTGKVDSRASLERKVGAGLKSVFTS